MSCLICGSTEQYAICKLADDGHPSCGVCQKCVDKARGKFTYCAFCGQEYPIDCDGREITEHIRSCKKHPMRELEVTNNILRAQIREALEMSYVPDGTLLYASMMKSVGLAAKEGL